ncbi:dienelactone hydrolase family protein [Rufibacter psychrotolerans]|uniref:dienelactone hydrolase family protein n=1 Tax=Rufibacter psychrotolerans TaxID=2812556 RepID=UPI0019671A8E|nr:dienelactone hydrolase family protein [Rufibacter sp. SYSU D00308]
MTNHDFITLPVADGTSLDAYVALPEGAGPFPGIILLQEAFGVNGHIRSIAERLCQEGYAIIAPDLFHRTVHRLEASYADFSAIMPHYQAITQEGLTADLRAVHGWLQEQAQVLPEKIGSIGFCLGGRVAFLANAVLPLAAGVSYYGGGLHTLTQEAAHLHGPHLFFWGGKDVHIPQEKIDLIINAVQAAGKEYVNTVISYADHGFHCDERESYHPQAAQEAWAMTLAFLANRLRPKP